MAFKEQTLTTTIDWDNVSANRFIMIKGRGQTVYWKGCNVTVYEIDNEGNEQIRKLMDMPDGEGIAEDGVKLYVTDGKVTEQ